MKKYDLSRIMSAAWKIFRKGIQNFAVALRMAWASAKAHNAAKENAGITEETHAWAGWRDLGYEVIHGSKALFGVDLIWGSRGDGATYKARFFGASQVQPIEGGAAV